MPETESKFEHWEKDRTFVAAVRGKYGELLKGMYERPRVVHTKQFQYKGGPADFDKRVIAPSITSIPLVTQSVESHILAMAPGARGVKHGHMNSAVMYCLAGKGYTVHDKERVDFQAGDAFVVRDACVHQVFNSDPNRPLRVLVMKSKPLFLFFNLMFQGTVEMPPYEAPAGWEGWTPEESDRA